MENDLVKASAVWGLEPQKARASGFAQMDTFHLLSLTDAQSDTRCKLSFLQRKMNTVKGNALLPKHRLSAWLFGKTEAGVGSNQVGWYFRVGSQFQPLKAPGDPIATIIIHIIRPTRRAAQTKAAD